ncbi:MAG: hypothetical protein U5L05_16000 [Rubrivivax sp.]|nr:hypothetical protein [Rubrivivax sp.]
MVVARAQRMIDWELSIQLPYGAFPGHFRRAWQPAGPSNTVARSRTAWWPATPSWSARSACDRRARGHLAWPTSRTTTAAGVALEHHDTPHVYENACGTWPLLAMGLIAGEARSGGTVSQRANLIGRSTQQTGCGWFADERLRARWKSPFTHAIAYAIRGFLESGVLLGERALPAGSAREPGAAWPPCSVPDGRLAWHGPG